MTAFSVVIPTLWRSRHTASLVEALCRSDFVKEVLIIDNANKMPDALPARSEKIRYLSFGVNIFVNPAWNVGVRNASSDYICLCNDDIIVDSAVFEFVGRHAKLEEQMIGAPENAMSYAGGEPLGITPVATRPCRWGYMIFFHRKNWIPIPEELRVWFGDDYLFSHNPTPKYVLSNLKLQGDDSTTSNSAEFDSVKLQDQINYQRFTSRS